MHIIDCLDGTIGVIIKNDMLIDTVIFGLECQIIFEGNKNEISMGN